MTSPQARRRSGASNRRRRPAAPSPDRPRRATPSPGPTQPQAAPEVLWTPPASGMPTFAALGLPEPLLRALAAHGFTEPFPIQAATLPDALAGRDLLGRGQTGSGKTLAFGLAVLARLAGDRSRPAPSPWAGPGTHPRARHPGHRRAPAVRQGARAVRRRRRGRHVLQPPVQRAAAAASTSSSPPPAASPTTSTRAPARSATSPSPRSTRPTGWPTWASCRRSGASSTRRRPTASGCCSPPPSTATSARSSCATSPIR